MEAKRSEGPRWQLDLVNASFLTGIPILAAVGMVWYTMNHGVSLVELAIFGFMYITCGLSITAGYHRLFSHRTHKAAWPLRLFYALFGVIWVGHLGFILFMLLGLNRRLSEPSMIMPLMVWSTTIIAIAYIWS